MKIKLPEYSTQVMVVLCFEAHFGFGVIIFAFPSRIFFQTLLSCARVYDPTVYFRSDSSIIWF
mgnify:CR=1 FL=1